jgi:hypothetical protein
MRKAGWTLCWYSHRFAVERECTCRKGDRFYECASGYHVVDSHPEMRAAIDDARTCARDYGHRYRVVDSQTGDVLASEW